MIPTIDRGLVLILLASALIQGLVLMKVREKPCRADECRYLHAASSIVAGRRVGVFFPEGQRRRWGRLRAWDAGHTPPLYVLFLSAHLIVFDGESWPTKVTQLLLVVAMGGLAYGIALAAWGRQAGLWAAGLVSFYPALIAFAHYNYSEVVYSFLLLLALSRVVAAKRRRPERQIRILVSAGVAFGLATLTRDVTLYLLPALLA